MHQRWAPRIDGSGGSVLRGEPKVMPWATPTKHDSKQGGGWSTYGRCLPREVLQTWPTPKTAGSGETPENWKRRAERVKNTPGSHGAPGMPLDVAVNWPTPDAGIFNYAESPESWDKRKQRHPNNGPVLSVEVKRGTTGRLNPAWVEGLMGFPAGWSLTDGPPLRDHSTRTSHREPDHDSPTTGSD